MSREDQIWQNELKDLIWLELQAFHADRTTLEEDAYLCAEREKIVPLLNDIMCYKFQRHSRCYSTQSSDSGVEDDCTGCLSIYCMSCVEAQNEALKDVEELVQRLAAAEALFPSGHAFAELYPLYNSPDFVARVKAISLWYNMTRQQRLKMMIVVKLLENKSEPSEKNAMDSNSPSDSNNSSSSSVNDSFYDPKSGWDSSPFTFTFVPFPVLSINKPESSFSPYRKYIENILKTRSLQKSLVFLDNLQFYVLRKVQLTLQKPEDPTIFDDTSCETEESELQRYGCCSPEAKAVNLPSYRAIFLFLAAIPLKMIHEFLKMRIEQKPEKPSPLSVRQLMRELKEGLKVATQQKDKIKNYIEDALSDTRDQGEALYDRLKDFDDCMLKIFSDYLDYVEQWALLHHETFQKNLLEDEWNFSCRVIDYIPGSSELLGKKFSFILCTILRSVAERMNDRIQEVIVHMHREDKNQLK